ncbi:DUF1800 domain-containing protein [Terrabacter sp. C0L_2]|uniref:DUF1800 domain-containing protein n=1 Tax=Terrabacter sp. C0L_2 TaxID=3108389 RepID=UPI002ED037DD|nr:DUF1800 domain-containing protein [Terrabacter sp. C0L_2]
MNAHLPASTGAATPRRRRVLSGIGAGAVIGVLPARASASPGVPTGVGASTTTDPVLHLLRRATFGPTPALASEVRAQGTTAWLDAQLAPATVPDTAMDAMLTRWPRLSWKTWEVREQLDGGDQWAVMMDLLEAHLARALFSRRQLLETVVDFWTNHLVVPVPSSEVWDSSHLFQRDVIRKHALGKYSDMLNAAARHPSMLKVLDNADSTKKAPNENYGRELLELHTVGLGNFTEADVKMSALALTGLSVDSESGLYSYKPQRRFVGTVKVLGWSDANTVPENGSAVATLYLNYLASHPATATRIATKLVTRYVSDVPPETLVSKLAQVYLANDTAIAPVLRALFLSPEFAASAGQKVRTPYEDALASCRILGLTPEPVPAAGVTSDLRTLIWLTQTFGQAPMGWPAPNGYPDVAAAWNGASSTLNRWNFHLGLAGNWSLKAMKRPDVTTLVPSPLPSTYAALVDALSARLLITLTTAQRDALCRFVDHAPGDALTSGAPAVTWRLPSLVALLLDSPNFATR